MGVLSHMSKNLLTDAAVKNAKAYHQALQAIRWRWLVSPGEAQRRQGVAVEVPPRRKEGLFAVGTFPDMGLAESREARDAARVWWPRASTRPTSGRKDSARKLAKAEARVGVSCW